MSENEPPIGDGLIEALADAWASIDGKLSAFRDGKGLPITQQPGGYYDGYTADANELLNRWKKRLQPGTPDALALARWLAGPERAVVPREPTDQMDDRIFEAIDNAYRQPFGMQCAATDAWNAGIAAAEAEREGE